jgi:hypothetical protein
VGRVRDDLTVVAVWLRECRADMFFFVIVLLCLQSTGQLGLLFHQKAKFLLNTADVHTFEKLSDQIMASFRSNATVIQPVLHCLLFPLIKQNEEALLTRIVLHHS